MANSFFNFLTQFVSGTTVKAGPVNDRFTEVQSGFDNVETASKSSLKVTGYSSSSGITATPDSFLMLNASGVPYASETLSFAPNFGGFKAQNLGDGVSSSDAITYGQAQTLINTAAYGSPTVVSLPSLTGNALKTLRVNAGGVATEWADTLPVIGAAYQNAATLRSVAGAATWVNNSPNLVFDPCMTGSACTPIPERYGTTGTGKYSGDLFAKFTGTMTVSHTEFAAPAGNVVVSADVYQTGTPTGTLLFVLEFYQATPSPVLMSSTSFSLIGTASDSARNVASTIAVPVGATYITAKIDASGLSQNVGVGRIKIESGTIQTPFSTEATSAYVALQKATTFFGYGVDDHPVVQIGGGISSGSGQTSELRFFSFAKATDTQDATIYASGGDAVTANKGSVQVRAKHLTTTNVIGYPSLVVNGALGATPTIDFMDGAKQSGSLSANAVITLTAPPSDIVFEAKLYLQQDATGSRTATFASSATIKHVGGSAKAPQAAANSETCYNVTWDGARFIISGYDL